MTSTLQRAKEGTLAWVFFACAALSILTTFGLVIVLFGESVTFFQTASPREFLSGLEWAPKWDKFGVLPLVCATLVVAGGALLIAVPVGLATAIYMSEYAPPAVRQIAKPVFEVLAGVPTIVFGYFALTFITPHLIQPLFPSAGIFNLLSAAIVVGVMIIPTVSSLCDDALRAVPQSLRQAAYAVAATRFEVSLRVVLPAALSGVFAAILLALARAVGETMAVYLAAGMQPQLTLNPLEAGQTMTGYIVQASLGDTPYGSIEYRSLFAVALCLFLMTFSVNWIAQRVLRRFREVYD